MSYADLGQTCYQRWLSPTKYELVISAQTITLLTEDAQSGICEGLALHLKQSSLHSIVRCNSLSGVA